MSYTVQQSKVFHELRAALVESSCYLGDAKATDRLTWLKCQYGNIVVTTDEATSVNQSHKIHQSNPNAPEPALPEPAVLSAIVLISDEDYWLTSCGMWKGPTRVAKNFADVKPTCTGTTPADQSIYAGDFKHVLTNLDDLLQKIRTPGYNDVSGMYKTSLTGSRKIRFRHILFEKLPLSEQPITSSGDEPATTSDDQETLSNNSTDNNLSQDFSIEYWPTQYGEAHEALATMYDTHRVIHLNAFDINGDIIRPSQYRQQLQGAVVQMRFTLSHWSIAGKEGKKPCDAFAADIQHIRVLIRPEQRAGPSPKKRKLDFKDPFMPTPVTTTSGTKKKKNT